MSVAEQQRRLAAAIRDDADATQLLAGDFATGLAVYRHAYRARLAEALADNYTVLARALGDDGFDALAQAYIAAHPSRHPSIRWFGHELADFMAARLEDPGDDLVPHASLVDFASMDWALRGAFDAADAPPLDPATLAALAPADWAGFVLCLHPSVQHVRLDHAIEPAWRLLREWEPESGEDQPELPEPMLHKHVLLAWRQAGDTRWRSLDPLEAALLDAVAAEVPFARLCEQAAVVLGDAEAAAPAVIGLLQRWLGEGLLRQA